MSPTKQAIAAAQIARIIANAGSGAAMPIEKQWAQNEIQRIQHSQVMPAPWNPTHGGA